MGVQGSTIEAAEDIAAFMVIFFEHFTKFKGRPFHFAGESYAVSLCQINRPALRVHAFANRVVICLSSRQRYMTRMPSLRRLG